MVIPGFVVGFAVSCPGDVVGAIVVDSVVTGVGTVVPGLTVVGVVRVAI